MTSTPSRIIAVDPTTRGLGYAIFELPFRLVECDLARVPGEKNIGALTHFEDLIERFRPDILVIEDTAAKGSRRNPRVRELFTMLADSARRKGMAVEGVSRLSVLRCFAPKDGRITKYTIAERLPRDFPELAGKLPKKRKFYKSENDRMAVFDAVAFAVTFAMR